MQDSVIKVLNEIAVLFPAFISVFTFHGFAKAFFAKLMGDNTPQEDGFLSLNPLAHVDMFGVVFTFCIIFVLGVLFPGESSRSLLFIFIIILGIRWTYPVEINESNFKYPKLGIILTSLSGSIGNFFLALLCMYFIAYFPFARVSLAVSKTVVEIFSNIIQLALFFGVLDLIPIPPFEGGRLLKNLLPHSARGFFEKIEEYSLFILLILFIVPGVSNVFFGTISMFVALIGKFLSCLVV
jgi:Zn-dependent protease